MRESEIYRGITEIVKPKYGNAWKTYYMNFSNEEKLS